jgi:hypothetical protein
MPSIITCSLPNMPLVPTCKSEALLRTAQRQRPDFPSSLRLRCKPFLNTFLHRGFPLLTSCRVGGTFCSYIGSTLLQPGFAFGTGFRIGGAFFLKLCGALLQLGLACGAGVGAGGTLCFDLGANFGATFRILVTGFFHGRIGTSVLGR